MFLMCDFNLVLGGFSISVYPNKQSKVGSETAALECLSKHCCIIS